MNFRYQLLLRLEKALDAQRNRIFDTSKIQEVGYLATIENLINTFGQLLYEKNPALSIVLSNIGEYEQIKRKLYFVQYQIIKLSSRSFFGFKWTANEPSLKISFSFFKKSDGFTYLEMGASHEDLLKPIAVLRDIPCTGTTEIVNETIQRKFLQLLDEIEQADYNIFERA